MNVVRPQVVEKLQQVSTAQLLELCERLKIEVPTAKQGKKKALFNLLIRFLSSDEIEEAEDEGLSVMVKLKGELDVMLDIADGGSGINTDGGTDAGGQSSGNGKVKKEDGLDIANSNVDTGVRTRVEVTKLREFKITGGSVGSGETGALEYMSLSYQMLEGKAVGYSYKEIKSGVIKAVKPGSPLRRYLESRTDIKEEDFIKILRVNYNVKDSSTLFNQMSNAFQEPTESELNFVLRMMDLRNNIVTLSLEEKCPFDKTLVRKKFFYVLSVGFRKDTVRLDLQNVLKQATMNDEDLLTEVNLVVSRELEHKNKTRSGKGVAVNALDGSSCNAVYNQSNSGISEVVQSKG